jgi:ribosomal protein S18 acetylase RimI-like enzyme
VGSALLRQAAQLSPEGLRLFTFRRNEPGRRFYEKHGFRAVKFGTSPPPESEPDVEYRWEPRPSDAGGGAETPAGAR